MFDEPTPGGWTFELAVAALAISAVVLVVAGTRFVHVIDRIADRTGSVRRSPAPFCSARRRRCRASSSPASRHGTVRPIWP